MRISIVASALVLILGLFGGSFLYASDWRISGEWTLVKTGSITIIGKPGARVFIDEKRSGSIGTDGTLEIKKVLPGARTALVAIDGAWPWTKTVTVQSDATVTMRPFLTPTSPNARVLQSSDPFYYAAKRSVQQIVLPSPAKPLQSPDSFAEIYVRDNILGAVWRGATSSTPHYFCTDSECGPVTVLRTPQGSVRNVAFYGDRSDVLIVAVTNGIFALDLDPTGTQNFQPLYLGTEPNFAPKDDHTLYIEDGAFEIELTY